jgi:hypothetical protein
VISKVISLFVVPVSTALAKEIVYFKKVVEVQKQQQKKGRVYGDQ